MSFNEEFEKKPVEFLHTYAIVPVPYRINDGLGKKVSTTRLSFREFGFKAGGLAKKALQLVEDADGFEAYWLAYEDNKSKRAVLGTAARFMFTANMDGCSFGFGSKTGTGEVLVAHANAAQVGTDAAESGKPLYEARKAQAEAQFAMLQKKMEPGTLAVLNPPAYADPFHDPESDATDVYKYAATVVGILEPSGWDFYCQLRVVTTKAQYVLRGVEKLNA
jgi:hypothetical protein